jgi:hypothetical protein
VKQMSKQTPQRAPVVEISGTNCSSGSGSGPVTTQRVTGRTDGQTHALREFIYKIHVHNYLLLQVCIIRYLGHIFYRWNLSTSRFKAGVTQHLHMHHPRFPVG